MAANPPDSHLYASQWQLMWLKFKSHRLAIASLWVLAFLYAITFLSQFLMPYDPGERDSQRLNAPPQAVHFHDAAGWHWPFVYPVKQDVDPQTMAWLYHEDTSRSVPVQLFFHGYSYHLWGVFPSNLHLFGVPNEPDVTLHLLGTDEFGRDYLSRVLIGGQISLSIGLVGVAFSFIIGLALGGISGYFGGFIDNIIQRLIELLVALPTLPLWMGLAAAVPPAWPTERIYLMMTIILSFVSWTGLARVVRGKILSVREEDFVLAARLGGAREGWIITRHLLPSLVSYSIVSLTMAVPGMILGETALSFLGLGLQPPAISWGVLLQGAQNLRSIALHPWLLSPAIMIIMVVLAFNFIGDGLRDAADPYVR